MNILLYFALKLNLYSYGEFNYSNPIDSSFLSFINVAIAGITEIIIIAITMIEKLLFTIGRFPKANPPTKNNNTHKAPPIKLYFIKLL